MFSGLIIGLISSPLRLPHLKFLFVLMDMHAAQNFVVPSSLQHICYLISRLRLCLIVKCMDHYHNAIIMLTVAAP